MFNSHTARTVVLLLAILLTWAPAGCQSPARQAQPVSQPPAPAPAAGTEPADQPAATDDGNVIAWAADGVITPGEYQKNKPFGDYELWWTADDQYIYMGMKAKTPGWVAVGFDPESMMKNSDIVEGFVKDGQLSIADMYSTGQFGPHPADTQLGGTDDILASVVNRTAVIQRLNSSASWTRATSLTNRCIRDQTRSSGPAAAIRSLPLNILHAGQARSTCNGKYFPE